MNYKDLIYLDEHLSYVSGQLPGKQIFIVGGAVRDMLLEVNPAPHDIDITLAANPSDVHQTLEKSRSDDTSLFWTEKYGTVTLIHNSQITEHKAQSNTEESAIIQNNSAAFVYEMTPFREETGYADNRHPDEIKWSDSLIADAKRRDFTLNCLYYTNVSTNKKAESRDQRVEGNNEESLIKQGWMWIAEQSLLVVQSHELIDAIFAKGEFQEEIFLSRAEKQGIGLGATVRFLIDPFLGIQDMGNGTVRCVGNPADRFTEDALRILRALRVVNTLNQKISGYNFDFEKETWLAMKSMGHLVKGLAKERLHQEIVKVFIGNNPFGWVALIDELGLLEQLFPALAANKHDDQPVRYHPFDTYSHILLTLRHLQQINSDYLVKLGMLYHDVGKKGQYAEYAKATTKEEMQAIHSSPANHVISGPVFAEEDFRALGFSHKELEEIGFYIANHMRPGQVLMARADNQKKTMRQLLSQYGYEKMKNLLDITVADRKGQYNPLQGGSIDDVKPLYDILNTLYEEEGQFTMRDMAIDGNDIMSSFQLEPSPKIKELLQRAFDWVLSDIPQRNTKQTILTYLHSIEQ